MYFLSFTFLFLTICFVFSTSQLQKASHETLINSCIMQEIERVDAQEKTDLRDEARRKFTQLCPPKKDGNNPTLSRRLFKNLDVAQLFQNANNPSTTVERSHTARHILKSLITHLYQDKSFFQEAKKNYPDLENECIDQLIKNSQVLLDKNCLKKEGNLANIEIQNDNIRDTIYRMLKGNEAKNQTASLDATHYPSLLKYLSFQSNKASDQDPLICVWLAPRDLLMVLFNNQNVVDNIVQRRLDILKQLKDENYAPKADLGASFKKSFQDSLSGIPVNLVDFGVSGTEPPNW